MSSNCNYFDSDLLEITWFYGANRNYNPDIRDRFDLSPVCQWSKSASHDINNPLQTLMGISHMQNIDLIAANEKRLKIYLLS